MIETGHSQKIQATVRKRDELVYYINKDIRSTVYRSETTEANTAVSNAPATAPVMYFLPFFFSLFGSPFAGEVLPCFGEFFSSCWVTIFWILLYSSGVEMRLNMNSLEVSVVISSFTLSSIMIKCLFRVIGKSIDPPLLHSRDTILFISRCVLK